MPRKRTARVMDMEESQDESSVAESSFSAKTSAPGSSDPTQAPKTKRNVSLSRSLDNLPWRNNYLNISALTAEDTDILCEAEEEDDEIMEPTEYECGSDEEWIPNADEASDIEIEGVVEAYEGEEDEEFELRGEVLVTAEKYIAPDLTEWYSQELPSAQTPSQSVLRKKGGPHHKFNKVMTAKEIFDEFMTLNIKNEILRHSNKKGNEVVLNFNQKNAADIAVQKVMPREFRLITMEEIDAFIGILLIMGINGASDDPLSTLWGNNCHPLYKASLSRERFQQILRVIRFDNAYTRSARKETDKAAPISDIWNMLMKNLQTNYYPEKNVTVDEQLFPYRGRTSFTQYIPTKPAKYGITIFWLCNSGDGYPLFGSIYTGKPPGGQRQVNVEENIVLALVDFYKQSGLNVTTDNFFTSLSLANRLRVRGMSLVGILRQNKEYIPRELRPSPTDDIGTHRYAFNKNGTLLSVVTKKKKSVFLLSTMHNSREKPRVNGKEEINDFYNKTKGGVDLMDQMVSKYSCKRKTNRWPLAIFFNMIDVAALGAFCVHSSLNPSAKKRQSSRRSFLTSLGVELATENMKERATHNRIIRYTNIRANAQPKNFGAILSGRSKHIEYK